MAPGDRWDTKRLEQRGDQLIEDGRPRAGDIHERTLELAGEGWEIVSLTPTERQLRRRRCARPSPERPRPYLNAEDPSCSGDR
jgi:hypothetical protein